MRFSIFTSVVKNLIQEQKKSIETVADIINKTKTQIPTVFNRDAKLRHRDKYAICGDHDHDVIKTMTSNLLDRLRDTTKPFEHLAILAGYSDYVLRDLKKYRSDIKNITCLEPSDQMVPVLKGCLAQCKLALKPDGMFLASMIGGHSLQELRISLNMAEQQREGGMSIRVSPFVKVSDVGSLLTEAGFKLMSIDIDNITIKYKDIYELIRQLKAADIYQEKFKEHDDLIPATFQIIYMIGWSPAPTQPQPLKRGSADKSLEDLDNFMDNLNFKTLEPEE